MKHNNKKEKAFRAGQFRPLLSPNMANFKKKERCDFMRIAYIRVSTVEQNEARQLEAMEKHSIEKYYIEKVSGKNTDRPKLQEMLKDVKAGDTVYIHDFSRLARSTKDLLELVEQLNEKGVHLVSNKENIDTSTPTGKLMLTMIGAINEFERTNMLERQREGVEIAKRNGKYKGGKKKDIDMELFNDLLEQFQRKEISKIKFAEMLGVSRPTLDKLLKDNEAV